MKFIHTADWHLDSKMQTHFQGEAAKVRRAELLSQFSEMIKYASKNGIKAILLSGDIFDKENCRKSTYSLVLSEIAAHPEIGFYYLSGNHDAKGFSEAVSVLPENLHVFRKEWKTYRIGCVVITGSEIKKNHPLNPDTLVLSADDVNIVMLHGIADESVTENNGDTISLKLFENKFIDYLALGHIHSYRAGHLGVRGTYAYAGCPEGRGFDECGAKGFVVLDINEEEKTVAQEFVPFSLRRIWSVDVSVDNCENSGDICAAVRERLTHDAEEISSSDMVRVCLTGEFDPDNEIDIPMISDMFSPNYFYFELQDKSVAKIDFTRYADDISLKGEFVRTVFSEDMPEEERTAILRAGFKALRGDSLT